MPTALTHFWPRRILVLHLGQLAEVILSQPALHALRQRFPDSHLTLAATAAGCQVGAMTTVVNDYLFVKSLQLKEVIKPWVTYRWIRFLRGIRQGRYDLTIDLQSQGGTNLLAWLSRAPMRLAARRPGKSLDFLFNIRPPREDRRKHPVDRYIDVLQPLGVRTQHRRPRLHRLPEADARVEKWLATKARHKGNLLIGIYPRRDGRHRCWPAKRFVQLGARLIHMLDINLLLLAGDQNSELVHQIDNRLPGNTIVLDEATIPELASALTACTVLITDDAGIANLAAAVNTPTVGLGIRFPLTPIGDEHVIFERLTSITVDEVFTAASRVIRRDRSSTLFGK